MGAAASYAMSVGLDAIWERNAMLATRLRTLLATAPGVTVHDIGSVQGAIVTFTVAGGDASALKAALHEQAINVSVVAPSSAPFDSLERELPALVRASVHYFNTDREIDRLVAAVADQG